MASTLRNQKSLLLFSAVFLLICVSSSSSSSSSSLDSKLSAIKDLCKSKANPQQCFDSMKLSISIGINPGGILGSLLNTLQDALSEGGKLSGILSGGQSDIVEKQKGTMKDCIELHETTLSLLKKSISNSGKISNPRKLADSKTYLSAALTNRETCLEGLESASGPSKPAILSSMDVVYDHVSQALSLMSQKSGKSVEKLHRRLLGFPSWITRRDRRILQGSDDEYGGASVFTVAADGSGDFTTITDAINAAPSYSNDRVIIRVMEGTYEENVDIPGSKTNIALIGEGSDVTVITGSRSVGDGWTTFRSATLGVHGDGFLARDITIQNTAGPEKHQAVALRVNADLVVLYRCAIKGFQDTLYVHSLRQFYRECDIYGTVDYIFGNAQAVIQASNVISRLPMPNQYITITAQSRMNESENTGISIQNCSIIPTNDLDSAGGTVRSYLGRPWRPYATAVIMDSYIDAFIAPEGWTPWSMADNVADGLSMVYYGEYNNYGPGSDTGGRVSAAGFHVMDHDEASRFTVSEFIFGDEWLGSTLVPYDNGVS